MLIEFDFRPSDSRQLEARQARILGHYAPAILVVFAAISAGLAYCSRDLESLGTWSVLIPLGAVGAFFATLLGVRSLVNQRQGPVRGLSEGQNTLHFSEAGVHHTGPRGTFRYPWATFSGVEVTVRYVFLVFEGEGVLPVPVTALERFGSSYDEAFLTQLMPLIQAGRRDM